MMRGGRKSDTAGPHVSLVRGSELTFSDCQEVGYNKTAACGGLISHS